MKIDFTPSVKTVEKMKKIAELREKGLIWSQIVPQVPGGHKERYIKELYRYYKVEMKGGQA